MSFLNVKELQSFLYVFTFWCSAGSWSSTVASWVWVAPPKPSWGVSPESDPEHTAQTAEEEAASPYRLGEPGDRRWLLVEQGEEEAHSLEVVVVEEVGLRILVMEEEGEGEGQCHQGEEGVAVEVEHCHQAEEGEEVGVAWDHQEEEEEVEEEEEMLNQVVEEEVVEEEEMLNQVVEEEVVEEEALSPLVRVGEEVVEEEGGVPQSVLDERPLLPLEEAETEAAADTNTGGGAAGSRSLRPTHCKALWT